MDSQANGRTAEGGEVGLKEYIVIAIAQETIDSFEAHNAPELIRCKDCKYGAYVVQDGMLPFVTCGGVDHELYWYCANGKRR